MAANDKIIKACLWPVNTAPGQEVNTRSCQITSGSQWISCDQRAQSRLLTAAQCYSTAQISSKGRIASTGNEWARDDSTGAIQGTCKLRGVIRTGQCLGSDALVSSISQWAPSRLGLWRLRNKNQLTTMKQLVTQIHFEKHTDSPHTCGDMPIYTHTY